ncbi:MAG: hypothetical protein WKF47_03755 [Geodermatophilaceae bacterium]
MGLVRPSAGTVSLDGAADRRSAGGHGRSRRGRPGAAGAAGLADADGAGAPHAGRASAGGRLDHRTG